MLVKLDPSSPGKLPVSPRIPREHNKYHGYTYVTGTPNCPLNLTTWNQGSPGTPNGSQQKKNCCQGRVDQPTPYVGDGRALPLMT